MTWEMVDRVTDFESERQRRRKVRSITKELYRKNRQRLFIAATISGFVCIGMLVLATMSDNAADVCRMFATIFAAVSAVYYGRWYEFGQIRGWK